MNLLGGGRAPLSVMPVASPVASLSYLPGDDSAARASPSVSPEPSRNRRRPLRLWSWYPAHLSLGATCTALSLGAMGFGIWCVQCSRCDGGVYIILGSGCVFLGALVLTTAAQMAATT